MKVNILNHDLALNLALNFPWRQNKNGNEVKSVCFIYYLIDKSIMKLISQSSCLLGFQASYNSDPCHEINRQLTYKKVNNLFYHLNISGICTEKDNKIYQKWFYYLLRISYYRCLYSPAPWDGMYLFQKQSESDTLDSHFPNMFYPWRVKSLVPLHCHQENKNNVYC